MRFALLALLVACGGSSEGPTCAPTRLSDCPTCEARHVIGAASDGNIYPLPNGGIAYQSYCNDVIHAFDGQAVETGTLDRIPDLVVGDVAYRLEATLVKERTPIDSAQFDVQLVGSRAGFDRWRADLGVGAASNQVAMRASVDGVYVYGLHSPDGSAPLRPLFAFSPDGTLQFTVEHPPDALVAFDGGFLAAYQAAKIERRDPMNQLVWSHPIGKAYFDDLRATHDGFAMVGVADGDKLDFGDKQIPTPDPYNSTFVAFFDMDGATQWMHAFYIGMNTFPRVVETSTGEIVFAARVHGYIIKGIDLPQRGQDTDTLIGVANAAGIERMHVIQGVGAQEFSGLEAAADGAVWVLVQLLSDIDEDPEGAHVTHDLRIGTETFSEDHFDFLLNIEP